MDTPRQNFAQRYYSSSKRKWVELEKEDLKSFLPEIYSDHPLCIYRDENGRSLSTVSQPSLVLYMLDLLNLKPGHRVFELGGGSGWNAAMMGRLVGPGGKVVSVEIIDCLVESAQASLNDLGLSQVDFSSGDAFEALEAQPPFDRGIFTASAWDLPAAFFEKITEGGLLVFVSKAQPNYDLLTLLRKESENVFVSKLNFPCSFVPVTGDHSKPDTTAIPVGSLSKLQLNQELSWNDIKLPDTEIENFIEFLKLVFDCQQTYLIDGKGKGFDEEFWGLKYDEESLLLFNEERLLLYGDDISLISARRAAKRWQKAKCPTIEDLYLSIHLSTQAPESTNDQWVVNRGDSCYLWSLTPL
nr:protein-L-isoaspartate O-methyltransferase [Pelagicoccus albus]